MPASSPKRKASTTTSALTAGSAAARACPAPLPCIDEAGTQLCGEGRRSIHDSGTSLCCAAGAGAVLQARSAAAEARGRHPLAGCVVPRCSHATASLVPLRAPCCCELCAMAWYCWHGRAYREQAVSRSHLGTRWSIISLLSAVLVICAQTIRSASGMQMPLQRSRSTGEADELS